jgi:C1A family cysteine protease
MNSQTNARMRGDIPVTAPGERVLDGHAIDAVGYDDAKKIGSAKGALRISNCCGTAWGEHGYGWMPYAYVERDLANDFWSLVEPEFVDNELFR